MKKNSINIISDSFFLINEHQTFRFDKNIAKNSIENIQFPIIVLDTEFMNHSHDENDFNKKLYDEKNRDLVYVIQYSFAKSLKEIAYRDNKKAIKSFVIKRAFNDSNYDFNLQYNKMTISFLNTCRSKMVKTIVCAGAVNDIKIINQWINKYKNLFSRKTLNIAFYNKESKELNANYFDIYEVLENSFSFSNTTSDGSEFYNANNLPRGKQSNDMIALTSSKKFFDWFDATDVNKILKMEDEDIKNLCKKAYKLYAYPKNLKMPFEEYKEMQKSVKKVINHCYNDVLKVLLFLGFIYEFSYVHYMKNSYIKK